MRKIEFKPAVESDRFPIAAQPHRCCQACRSECQPDPKPLAGEELTRGRCQRSHRHAAPAGICARWDTIFLFNHDNPRILSTFGDDSPAMRVPSAKLFEAMILTLRGTPFLFEGDELGMTDFPFKTLADYDDIAVKNAYKALVDAGKISPEAFLTSQARVSRDNAHP